MNYCSICGNFVSSIAHVCTRVEIAYESVIDTTDPNFVKQFQGFFRRKREPVPDVFQHAFRDEELEL